MAISPQADAGKAREKVEAALALRRMEAGGGDRKSGKANLPDPIADTGEAREKVAAALGAGGDYHGKGKPKTGRLGDLQPVGGGRPPTVR